MAPLPFFAKATRIFPSLNGFVIFALIGVLLFAGSTLLPSISGVFGKETRSTLRVQVQELQQERNRLQEEINTKSLEMEKMKDRHREELVAIRNVHAHAARVEQQLVETNQQLREERDRLAARMHTARQEVVENCDIDREEYIVLPRALVSEYSNRNYDILLTFIESAESTDIASVVFEHPTVEETVVAVVPSDTSPPSTQTLSLFDLFDAEESLS